MSAADRTILLVEDNEDDVFIFRRAYRQASLPHRLQVVGDGQAAIDYLQGQGAFADRAAHPAPSLVVLDLKLPGKSGLEVLREIREQPAFAGLPVVVLTSSAEVRDVTRARELGAEAYLVKPPAARVLAEAAALLPADGAPAQGARPAITGDKFQNEPPPAGGFR